MKKTILFFVALILGIVWYIRKKKPAEIILDSRGIPAGQTMYYIIRDGAYLFKSTHIDDGNWQGNANSFENLPEGYNYIPF